MLSMRRMAMSRGVVFVISGPSGVGKGTLLNALIDRNKDKIGYSVSATTRDKRDGEIEGVHYFFKTNEEFDELIKIGDVLEYDTYSGNRYGTLKSVLMDAINIGKSIALDITVPGAMALKESLKNDVVTVFIMPPSVEVLRQRLTDRNREGLDEIEERIRFAVQSELSKYYDYDYVVINNDLEKAVDDLENILNAEFLRVNRNPDLLDKV
ncbi:MAG: guanylate kinase [Ruminococcaceae bacterium]|nr:guanylate kinase [Oscillospiraceae bacterium]